MNEIICQYCGKPITVLKGLSSESLVIHNHTSPNPIPVHRKCHNSIHKKGNKNTLGKHWKLPFKHKSEEHKANISKALKGKNVERGRQLGLANKGRKHTEEEKRKIGEACKGHRGHHHKFSDEQRMRISEGLKKAHALKPKWRNNNCGVTS